MTDLFDLARRAVGRARSGEHLEAYASWGRGTVIKALGGEIESLSRAESRGLGVRVIAGARLGYAYAADPEPDDLAWIVEQARTNASLTSPDDGNVLLNGGGKH